MQKMINKILEEIKTKPEIKKIYKKATIIGLIIFFFNAFIFRGYLLSWVLTFFLCIIFFAIFIIFIFRNVIQKIKKQKFLTIKNHKSLSSIIPFTLTMLSLYVGILNTKMDVNKAKKYCESIAPIIKDQKIETSLKKEMARKKFKKLNLSAKFLIEDALCSYQFNLTNVREIAHNGLYVDDPFSIDGYWLYISESKWDKGWY